MINASPSNRRSFVHAPRSICGSRGFHCRRGALAASHYLPDPRLLPQTSIDKSAVNHNNDNSTRRPSSTSHCQISFCLRCQAGPVTVETFAADCTSTKTVFNLQDTDLTVCAQIY